MATTADDWPCATSDVDYCSTYGPPDVYLGSQIRKWRHPDADDDEPYCYSISGDHYVKNVVTNVQRKLQAHGRELNAKQQSPMTTGYRPELDTSPELDANNISYYQELIGCLRWAIELGRADIATEVALLSRHLAMPRRGHLDQCFNIIAYLKRHPKSKLVLNPAYMDVRSRFSDRFVEKADWHEFYGDVREEILPNAPSAHGKGVEVFGYVDADHAGDRLTQ